jgi:type II pantothenate kinase
MARLAQLVGDNYRACTWDLRDDAAGRKYWCDHFQEHYHVLPPLIREVYPRATEAQLAGLAAEYRALYDDIEAHPERYGHVDVLLMDEVRGALLARYGFDDPFAGIKRREDEAALALLPGVLAELDAATPEERCAQLVLGLMAGNIFDLGAQATIARYRNGDAGFAQARRATPARPWFCDDVAAWWARWEARPCEHVLFFADNAGSDLVLGCLPLVRWMLQAGARVTLAANSGPALNDITAAELTPLLERCAGLDGVLGEAHAAGRLCVVATGNAAPLIDLTRLTPECVAATQDADLVWLHGMGRAIESNMYARFGCDAAWTAVLKDDEVATQMGGKLFDCVFRFRVA